MAKYTITSKQVIGSIVLMSIVLASGAVLYYSDIQTIWNTCLTENPDLTYCVYSIQKDTSTKIIRIDILTPKPFSTDRSQFVRWTIDRDQVTVYNGRTIGAKAKWYVDYYKTYGEDQWVTLARKASSITLSVIPRADYVDVVKKTDYYASNTSSGTGGQLIETFRVGQNWHKYTVKWIPASNRLNADHRIRWNVFGFDNISNPSLAQGQFSIKLPNDVTVNWKDAKDQTDNAKLDTNTLEVQFKAQDGNIFIDPSMGILEGIGDIAPSKGTIVQDYMPGLASSFTDGNFVFISNEWTLHITPSIVYNYSKYGLSLADTYKSNIVKQSNRSTKFSLDLSFPTTVNESNLDYVELKLSSPEINWKEAFIDGYKISYRTWDFDFSDLVNAGFEVDMVDVQTIRIGIKGQKTLSLDPQILNNFGDNYANNQHGYRETDQNVYFVGTANDKSYVSIYGSTNNGTTWAEVVKVAPVNAGVTYGGPSAVYYTDYNTVVIAWYNVTVADINIVKCTYSPTNRCNKLSNFQVTYDATFLTEGTPVNIVRVSKDINSGNYAFIAAWKNVTETFHIRAFKITDNISTSGTITADANVGQGTDIVTAQGDIVIKNDVVFVSFKNYHIPGTAHRNDMYYCSNGVTTWTGYSWIGFTGVEGGQVAFGDTNGTTLLYCWADRGNGDDLNCATCSTCTTGADWNFFYLFDDTYTSANPSISADSNGNYYASVVDDDNAPLTRKFYFDANGLWSADVNISSGGQSYVQILTNEIWQTTDYFYSDATNTYFSTEQSLYKPTSPAPPSPVVFESEYNTVDDFNNHYYQDKWKITEGHNGSPGVCAPYCEYAERNDMLDANVNAGSGAWEDINITSKQTINFTTKADTQFQHYWKLNVEGDGVNDAYGFVRIGLTDHNEILHIPLINKSVVNWTTSPVVFGNDVNRLRIKYAGDNMVEYYIDDINQGNKSLAGLDANTLRWSLWISGYVPDAGFSRPLIRLYDINAHWTDLNINVPNAPGWFSSSNTKDGNSLIDFNVMNPDSTPDGNYNILAMVYYSTTQAAKQNHIADLNLTRAALSPTADVNCSGSNFTRSRQCYYDFNFASLPDGNYYIDINATGFEIDSSSYSFAIDFAPPVTTTNMNQDWNNSTMSFYLKCTDATSGCLATRYRHDKDPSNTVTYGNYIKYTDGNAITWDKDGNFAFDFNSIDNAGNNETTTTKYLTRDTNAPGLAFTDTNTEWQTVDANLAVKCKDSTTGTTTSGCSATRFQKGGTGKWITILDGNGLYINFDQNTRIDFNSTDVAGNEGTTYVRYVLIDNKGPAIKLWEPQDRNMSVREKQVRFDVNKTGQFDTNTDTIRVDVNGIVSTIFVFASSCVTKGKHYACSYIESTLIDINGADYNLTIRADDNASFKPNRDNNSSVFQYIFPNIQPKVYIYRPNDTNTWYWSNYVRFDVNNDATEPDLNVSCSLTYVDVNAQRSSDFDCTKDCIRSFDGNLMCHYWELLFDGNHFDYNLIVYAHAGNKYSSRFTYYGLDFNIGNVNEKYLTDENQMDLYPTSLLDYNVTPDGQNDLNGYYQICNKGGETAFVYTDINIALPNDSNMFIGDSNIKDRATDWNKYKPTIFLPALITNQCTKAWVWADLNLWYAYAYTIDVNTRFWLETRQKELNPI